MKKLGIVVTLLAVVVGLYIFSTNAPKPQTSESTPKIEQSQATEETPTASEALPKAAAVISKVQPKAESVIPRQVAIPNLKDLGLNLVLGRNSDHLVIQGQAATILGTQQIKNSAGAQSIVVTADQKSGQLRYFSEGVQITLNPGASLQSLQQTYPNTQINLATTSVIQLHIEASQLAANYNAMSADKNIASVVLLPVRMPVNPK